MPLYEYRCKECDKTFEQLVMGEADHPACPDCGNVKVERLLSAHSAASGPQSQKWPGAGDTTCCGSSPGQAGCAGPGSCCGRGPA